MKAALEAWLAAGSPSVSAVTALAALLVSYVFGSVPTGLWLGLALRRVDIREHGSKNIGATNTLRVLGKPLGAIALICDMAKGFLPVWAVGYLIAPTAFPLASMLPLLCGVAAILGHSFSLFLRFRGGKGVATSTGVFLALAPVPVLTGAYAFAAVLIATQMVSAGSVTAACVVAAMVFILPVTWPVRIMTIAIAALVVYKHRDNLRRIARGEESRMWDPEQGRRLPSVPGGLFLPCRTDYAAAVLVAVGALMLYVTTLAPTVTGEDSGEFITAAYALGIPHPPGYPLYVLAAHAFTCLPVGDIAWRVALSSAFFSALACGISVLIGILLTRHRLAAVLGGLALACSRELWQQSVIAEVYGLNLFMVSLCVFLLFRWHALKHHDLFRDRPLYALAVVCGLGQGAHNTMVLVAPLLAIYILLADGAPLRRMKVYVALFVVSVASAVAVYLYLPLASLANPPLDWGNPETLGNFWDVARRKQFAFMFFQYPRSLARFIGQMSILFGMWGREFAPWCMVLAVGGFVWLIRRRLPQALFLAALSLIVVSGFAFMQNFEIDKEWLWIMSVFGVPAYLCTSIVLGAGIAALLGALRSPWARAAASGVALLAIGAQVPMYWHENDKSDFYWARDYGVNVLESLEPNAIWVPEMDHESFAALYLQSVEGLRPDVSLVRTCGYVDTSTIPNLPEERREAFGPFPPRRYEPEIFAWLIEHTDRPVYFSTVPKLDGAPEIRFAPWGFVHRALRPGEPEPQGDPWNNVYRWHHPLAREYTHGDFTAELILYQAAMAHAEEAYRKSDTAAARQALDEAEKAYGPDPNILNNLATLSARHQDWEQAKERFMKAHEMAPDNKTIVRNLERVRELAKW